VYDASGEPLAVDLVPFARSVASTVVSLQEPYTMNRLDQAGADGSLELQPFERGRQSLLAAPMAVTPGIQVVLELFDKQPGQGGMLSRPYGPPTAVPEPEGRESMAHAVTPFTPEDQRLVAAAADFGAEMLRQALAERQMHQVLFDAVDAALGASDSVATSLRRTASERREEPPPAAVLDKLREGLSANAAATMDAEETLRLAEAVRVLAVRHGPGTVRHCIRLVEELRDLLDSVTGVGESPS
jgi:hypothetical protein